MDTPVSKYDLINSINSRGTFCLTRACLPHMQKGASALGGDAVPTQLGLQLGLRVH